MIADPRFAPRRDDLPYLRRRKRPKAIVAPTSGAQPKISFDRPGRQPVPPPAVAPATVSFERPARRPATPTPAPATSSPDLDAPAQPASPAPPPPAPTSASLDLDAPAPSVSVPVQAPAEPPRRVRDDPRVRAGGRKILTVSDQTVTLTRLQSAIGTLLFEAAVSREVGDLRIGCAYQLRSGESSTVELSGEHQLAPARSRRPVIIGGHGHDGQFGRISVDLRQSVQLQRLAIYAYSESRAPLAWGGTLIAETFGGAKIELPLESLRGGDVAMLMSLYNVRGEFVLRAEMQALNGDVREACRAYGYDRITWLDDRTPVD